MSGEQYADALIRLLRLIKEKSEYLEGEIDKFVLTAVNSLRAADSVSAPLCFLLLSMIPCY